MLLLVSAQALAADRRLHLWSQEFLPHAATQLEGIGPFYWGKAWEGAESRFENEERLFSLASVKKVITAATALRELGGDYRFINEFSGSLDITQNALFSPMFSVSGDPTWGHPSYGETLTTRIAKIIAELKKQNVKRVIGEIQVYSLRPAVSQFARPKEWKQSWLLECYAALPSPVSLYGNCAEMAISPSKKVYWKTPGVNTPIENKLYFSRTNSVKVVPTLDVLGRIAKYTVSGGVTTAMSGAFPVQNNEGWLKNLLIREMRAAGITYTITSAKFKRHHNLSSFSVDLSSKKLREILIPFLQDSINLVGDRLHIEAADDFGTLASLIPDPTEYQNASLLDGSGLIAANKITPKAFLHLLKGLKAQPYFQDLYAALPVSGVSGTLQNRMNDALLKNRVHAKTGTIDGVANLAGYWVKADESLEPFVIFTESSEAASTVRAKVDALVSEFARKN